MLPCGSWQSAQVRLVAETAAPKPQLGRLAADGSASMWADVTGTGATLAASPAKFFLKAFVKPPPLRAPSKVELVSYCVATPSTIVPGTTPAAPDGPESKMPRRRSSKHQRQIAVAGVAELGHRRRATDEQCVRVVRRQTWRPGPWA